MSHAIPTVAKGAAIIATPGSAGAKAGKTGGESLLEEATMSAPRTHRRPPRQSPAPRAPRRGRTAGTGRGRGPPRVAVANHGARRRAGRHGGSKRERGHGQAGWPAGDPERRRAARAGRAADRRVRDDDEARVGRVGGRIGRRSLAAWPRNAQLDLVAAGVTARRRHAHPHAIGADCIEAGDDALADEEPEALLRAVVEERQRHCGRRRPLDELPRVARRRRLALGDEDDIVERPQRLVTVGRVPRSRS